MSEILLTAKTEIQAAEGKPARVEIVAYSGGVMTVGPFGPVVLDVAGLELGRVTLLADHEATLKGVVGHGEATTDGRQILVAGEIPLVTDAARDVVALSKAGVEFHASVGVAPGERSRIGTGETASVNGRTLKGPFTLVKSGKLREVSITALGADSQTAVKIAAKKGADMSDEIQTVDSERVQAKSEMDRLKDIRAITSEMLNASELYEIKQRGVDEGWTPEKTLVEVLRAERPSAPLAARGSVGTTELITCGFASRIDQELAVSAWGEQTVEAARPYANMRFLDICAQVLRMNGQDVPTNTDMLLASSMSGSSLVVLSEILTTAPRRILEEQLRTAAPTWAAVARRRVAADFRTHKSVRLRSDSGLDKVPKGGEIKNTSLSEETYDWAIDTYAKRVTITRQDAINDDLGAFDDLPRIFANDALQSIGDVFYDVLKAGQTAGFFAAGNNNLLTGGSSPLSSTSLATAVQQLREMTDNKGRLLNIVPRVLLVPPALEYTARGLLNSAQLGRDDEGPTGNPLQGVARLEVEGRIGAAGGGSDTNWYLFGDPGAMQVAFLNSLTPAPQINFYDFNTDPGYLNMSWRVVLDHGSARGDHRFAIKSAGA